MKTATKKQAEPATPSLSFKPGEMTIRERLLAGPVFVPERGVCIGCGDFREGEGGVVDKSTGLGILCWRAWRWSSVREQGPLPE